MTTTLKQTLENHILYVVFGFAATGFVSGWAACEMARVAYKTEKISDYERKIADQSQQIRESAAAVEPYQKQISELLSNTKRLEAELSMPRGNANCTVIGLVRAVEGKKEQVERQLTNAYQWDSENQNIEDYKRQISEYQTRLIALQEKLACASH